MLVAISPCERISLMFSQFTHVLYASLPVNPERDVKRVLSRFKLFGEQEVLVDTFRFVSF